MGALQQLAGGQIADEASVGGKEVVVGKVFEAGPADLVVDAVDDFAGEFMHGEKLQVNGAAMAIVVADVGNAGADDGVNAKLFFQFPGQCSHCEAMGWSARLWPIRTSPPRTINAAATKRSAGPLERFT